MFRGAIVRTSVAWIATTAAGPANGDPSEYVDVLLSDAGKKRAAQRALKKRLAARVSAAAAPPATGIGNIRAGEKSGATVEAELRAPTLGDVVAELERAHLFGILEELVLWKNTTNEEVLKRARTEIWQSWRRACAENAGHPRAVDLFADLALGGKHSTVPQADNDIGLPRSQHRLAAEVTNRGCHGDVRDLLRAVLVELSRLQGVPHEFLLACRRVVGSARPNAL